MFMLTPPKLDHSSSLLSLFVWVRPYSRAALHKDLFTRYQDLAKGYVDRVSDSPGVSSLYYYGTTY